MILVIDKDRTNYRLNTYSDFRNRLPLHYKDVVFAESSHDKTINDMIDGIGTKPDIIYIMDGENKPSDLTEYKVYALNTDSPLTNQFHIGQCMKHRVNYEGVFYNYKLAHQQLYNVFNTKNIFYYPCSASHVYDIEKYDVCKKIDFFMSGQMTEEYEYRKKFKDMEWINCIDKFSYSSHYLTNEEFLSYILYSKWSPHDGGINGRLVPRYYESGFAKSVIISPDLSEMSINGFIHGENCLLFNRNYPYNINVHKYDWSKLADNAYQLTKERHCTDVRIKQFLETVL